MIEVKCGPHLEKVRAFADRVGAREELEATLSYLENYRGGECLCVLYHDLAPHSFGFELLGPEREDGSRNCLFNGGVIYYGPGESGASAPQYSVSLAGALGGAEAKKHRWEVHT